MRKIFIDLGAYDGDTIREFLNWGWPYGDPSEFIIYAFEPNPKFEKQLSGMGVIYSNRAAWIEEGEAEFAADPTETPMGSTLMSSKRHLWEISPHIKVPTFDLSEWVKQFKDDFVILKMDIEGAEFPVLRKMIDDKTVQYIDHLWVEMHPNKVEDFTSQDRDKLVEELKQLTNFRPWH